MESLLDEDFPETATRSLLVAVKTLNNDASQQARYVRGRGGGVGGGGGGGGHTITSSGRQDANQ